ncbi:hypothetical protein SERLA73DRAFT_177559 [Serpula lacrymans var. lacrymans S7.3]|uniref:COP9 signalosome complex subunit 4 n=2 Tax=Serpula lacrymans var. lacrymans TaxID=341189 RepID=F8PP47_SERL3|nr:uncharacterized protein SERLADRAFT_461218 [Serpula lacrymans var. lacrymans S7.9]EGO01924.1 hypothetical protein SERLA73DRAFT_177559 [Serpula lacrymans var. lacrymans S7.3]EGO27551.1 hypothetical protein SERLADRAFT_461218 [Serpula lacrymans var. lacrymans S7.9]
MESKLVQFSSLSQKDKAPAYLSLIPEVLSQSDQPAIAANLHTLVDTVVNQESVGLVIGRQVLSEIVKNLEAGAIPSSGLRKRIVEDTLATIQPHIVSYEEQVNSLRYQLADLLESEEEWSEAARVLMGISVDSGQRALPDEEKLRLYIRIVRLLLEEEDSVQAETYYNRAASVVHSTNDKETLLQFKLCQARISDYARKFLEAAMRYHELSWVAEIDEEERREILSAAVTCAVLAPAGPNRSRVLASLYRDERSAELPTFNILSKMFLDHILRPAEIKSFEEKLRPHQLAKIAISSNDQLASTIDDDDLSEPNASTRRGPATVLDRAVMEHNLLASSKIYNNITFRGLGGLLDLTPGAAETMARKMIEQGRLKGFIDQVDKLIWFDDGKEEDDAQGKAGGLGDVEQSTEDTGAPFTKRWDMQIRMTAANVDSIVQHLAEKGLVNMVDVAA